MSPRQLVVGCFGALVFAGCPGPGYVPTQPTGDALVTPQDAALPVPTPDGDACSQQCGALRVHGCPGGTGFPGGESCEDVCRRRALVGIAMPSGC